MTTTQSLTETQESEEDFVAFYERYAGLVRHVLLSFSNESSREAEDLAQEAFLRAWKSGKYRTVADPKNWIAIVAKNIARDFYKSKRRLRDSQVVNDLDEVAETTFIDEQTKRMFAYSEESDALAAAYHSLSPKDQKIIVLLLLEYQNADIARELGLQPVQAHRRVERARRNFLQNYHGELWLSLEKTR